MQFRQISQEEDVATDTGVDSRWKLAAIVLSGLLIAAAGAIALPCLLSTKSTGDGASS